MQGFRVMSVNFADSCHGTNVRVANDDGVEFEYRVVDSGVGVHRTLYVYSDGFPRFAFDFDRKEWRDSCYYYYRVVSTPGAWREEWFQVVDCMVGLLERGAKPLLGGEG